MLEVPKNTVVAFGRTKAPDHSTSGRNDVFLSVHKSLNGDHASETRRLVVGDEGILLAPWASEQPSLGGR